MANLPSLQVESGCPVLTNDCTLANNSMCELKRVTALKTGNPDRNPGFLIACLI